MVVRADDLPSTAAGARGEGGAPQRDAQRAAESGERPWRRGGSARLLTIGAADPAGAAGIYADLQVAAAMKAVGTGVATTVVVTAEDGNPDYVDFSAEMVGRQLSVALASMDIQAVKVGLLPTPAIVDTVVDSLSETRSKPTLVVDATCVDGDGLPIVDADVFAHLKRRLIVGAGVLVAGIREAEILAGMTICTLEDKRHAALMLRTIGAETVVLIDASGLGDRVVEFVAGPGEKGQGDIEEVMDYPRPVGWEVVGVTGAMATAIAVALARGVTQADAVRQARAYVVEAVRLARARGGDAGDPMTCPPHFPV